MNKVNHARNVERDACETRKELERKLSQLRDINQSHDPKKRTSNTVTKRRLAVFGVDTYKKYLTMCNIIGAYDILSLDSFTLNTQNIFHDDNSDNEDFMVSWDCSSPFNIYSECHVIEFERLNSSNFNIDEL